MPGKRISVCEMHWKVCYKGMKLEKNAFDAVCRKLFAIREKQNVIAIYDLK